ncbi:MAG: gamma-glutamyl-gamma-aminobutyrate hydrolase family protein [Clostridia bacterium]|nr:gamma-glutamyl-gamma-aminobutyrate hydrolase family protein [Clostridia bacterium]
MDVPKIGITCGEDVKEGKVFLTNYYLRCVQRAGGIPWLIPSIEKNISDYLSNLDGIVLSGGVDVDPLYFGEEPIVGMGEITPGRDNFEIKLTQAAIILDIPILAICRGVQVLNIALGGNIYQDILSQVPGVYKHTQDAPKWYPSHTIHIIRDSILEGIFKSETARVNSFHHQAVSSLADGVLSIASTSDGIVEAITMPNKKFVLGVQWHPECMADRFKEQQQIFNEFVKASIR